MRKEETDSWRYQLVATNTPGRQLAFLEARHRAHARGEDFIRCAKAPVSTTFPRPR